MLLELTYEPLIRKLVQNFIHIFFLFSTGDSTVGWIGLQGFLGEGYHWIDDSPLDYVNWESKFSSFNKVFLN
jgi:hypothetical protein